jgi:ABC-type Fe3+/spermidine/putrescine transport system ATPase subunit
VRLSAGTTIQVPTSRIPSDLAGSQLKVGVRPEKISILTGDESVVDDSQNHLRGRVKVSTFTGVGNQYLVESASGVEITVYAQNIGEALAPRSGEDVTLTWPVEHTFAVVPTNEAFAESDDIESERETQ